MRKKSLLLKMFLFIGIINLLVLGCSQEPLEPSPDPPPGGNNNGGILKSIDDVCYFTYKNGKVSKLAIRKLPYLSDTSYVYYNSLGKVNKVVRKRIESGLSLPEIWYTIAYYFYNDSKVSQITYATQSTWRDINPDTLNLTSLGVDTVSSPLFSRIYFNYDSQGRLFHLKHLNFYDDTLMYSDNTNRNISRVVRKWYTSREDSVAFSKYESYMNPVYKYVPELFYLIVGPLSWGDYSNVCQPFEFASDDLTCYLALCPNFIKSLKFWYIYTYSNCYCEEQLENFIDNNGNIIKSRGWLDFSFGIEYSYSY